MSLMKVVVLALAPLPGHPQGVASYTAPLADHLAASGLEVKVWAQRGVARRQTGREHTVPVWRPGFLLGLDLLRELRRSRPDILHVQFEFGIYGGVPGLVSLLGALALSRVVFRQSIIVTSHQVLAFHDLTSDTLRQFGIRLPPWAARIVFRFVVMILGRCSDRVIVHGEVFRERLLTEWGLPSRLVRVVPHGAPQTDRPPSFEDRRLLLFGYIKRYKGIENAIEAFRRLAGEFPEWTLTIAGKAASDEYLQELRALARPLGPQVEFTGYVEEGEVGEVLERAAIVLLPYRTLFSSSGPMADAIGHHKPFVISEELRPLCPSWPFWCELSPEQWAHTLRGLMRDEGLRAQAGRMAGRLAEDRRWPVVAAQTAHIYRQILGDQHEPGGPEAARAQNASHSQAPNLSS